MWTIALNDLDLMRFFGADIITQKIETLKNVPIFHELTRKEILEVDELLHERVYEKDEVVFEGATQATEFSLSLAANFAPTRAASCCRPSFLISAPANW